MDCPTYFRSLLIGHTGGSVAGNGAGFFGQRVARHAHRHLHCFLLGRCGLRRQRRLRSVVSSWKFLRYALRNVPAASSVAAKTLGYVPQRHRLPETAWRTSCSEGCGFRSSNAAQLITMPGVQNPHCIASCFTNAACSGCDLLLRRQPFDRGHMMADGINGQRHAAVHRHLVQPHGAAGADASVAHNLGPGHAEMDAQSLGQRRARLDLHRVLGAVHVETHGDRSRTQLGHALRGFCFRFAGESCTPSSSAVPAAVSPAPFKKPRRLMPLFPDSVGAGDCCGGTGSRESDMEAAPLPARISLNPGKIQIVPMQKYSPRDVTS